MSRPPLFEFSGSAPANCAQKCTVQTASDLNYCMYIFYKHYLNFETKMIFLCILIVWSHEEIISSVRMCRAVAMLRQQNLATILNDFSQSLKTKKNLLLLV